MSDQIPSAHGGFGAGFHIGGYRLDEQIGRGRMAVVYGAHDARLERRVALKIFAPELARDEEFRARFIRESRVAASVDHPNIIPVFEAGEAGGLLFLAMRLVDGRDVQTLISQQDPLPAARVCGIVAQVASALDAVHAHGLVHGNVKPGNMLREVTSGPAQRDHIYLSGFGQSGNALGTSAALSSQGQPPGTLNYLAPEQIEGRAVDGRTDEYALACSAFEMLAGQPPFRRHESPAIIWAQVSSAPPSVTSMRPDLPGPVDQVMARALAKEPVGRYGTCLEFAAALRQACGLEPGAGTEPGAAMPGHGATRSTAAAAQPPTLAASTGDLSPPVQAPAAQAAVEQAGGSWPGAAMPPAPSRSGRQAKRRRAPEGRYDDAISRAVKAAVKPGLLTFNPPAEMVQGRKERVEVGIARSPELRDALATGLRGRGELRFEEISTSPYMGVELSGDSFEVVSFSPIEQLVAPVARWEFDVMPFRAGHQKLTLCVSLRIDSRAISGGRIAVPVLEREIRIRVDIGFSTSRFLAKNWQWLIATILALGGAIAAWVTLFR